MKAFFKGLALFVLVVIAVWFPVLWHWQNTNRDVSVPDIIWFLVVLPLVAYLVLVLLRWAWRSVVVPAAGTAAATAATPPPAAGGSKAPAASSGGASGEAAERHRLFAVLAAQVCLPAGSSLMAVENALKDGKLQPQLDAELRDDEGMPVVCGRLPELDLTVLDETLLPLLEAARAQPEAGQLGLSPATARALAALQSPLIGVGPALLGWQDILGDPLPGAPPEPAANGPKPRLRVLLNLDVHTPAFDRQLAEQWVRLELSKSSRVPEARIQIDWAPGSGAALWQAADRLLMTLAREKQRDLVVLAAAHSDLDEQALQRWQSQNRLFKAQANPKGQVPGEGAAVVVLAQSDWPPSPYANGPMPFVHRPAWADRDKPVDSAGRISSQVLEAVIDAALLAAPIDGKALERLVSDADRHGPRNGELFGAVLAKTPQLDALEDVVALAALCGHQATTGFLASVALASEAATDDKPPLLVVTVDDPKTRLALLVRRGPLPAPTPASAASPAKAAA